MMSSTVCSASRLFEMYRSSLRMLGCSPDDHDVETASMLVFQAMTGSPRDYHGIGHVFSVASGQAPIGKLAAIYHDTVYRQVDQGFLPALWDKISDAAELRDGKVFLRPDLPGDVEDVAAIFGFARGQELQPFGGLNELMSAVLAARELARWLDRKRIWAVVACIEATIPFRKADACGKTASQALAARLGELARLRVIPLTASEIEDIVESSVMLANSDVQSFGQSCLGSFLDETWKLLPESNPFFYMTGIYTLRKYREALCRTEGFLSSLDPAVVFQQYGTRSPDAVVRQLRERAAHNLTKGSEYLRAKIVAISLLEALAEVTGGDVPVSYFTGLANSGEAQIHERLPEPQFGRTAYPPVDPVVLQVLRYGRSSSTDFDTAKSPLAAYLYEVLGTAGVTDQYRRAKQAHAGKQQWRWFIDGMPGALVGAVAVAAAGIALSRSEKLLALAGRVSTPRAVA